MSIATSNTPPKFYCSYDDVSYPSLPFRWSHPDHLHALGMLFGLNPQSPDCARILELGCASAGNLLPLAEQLPQAELIGVDLSTRQIAEGRRLAARLKLENVVLQVNDIGTIGDSLGRFDYIICHGVFSWVSQALQQQILAKCAELLSERGLAYISYNTYPGWFSRGMVRQMMLHHLGQSSGPKNNAERICQAREFLQFLVDCTRGQNSPYAQALRNEQKLLAEHPDEYLFHEHLDEFNHPLFFSEFLDMSQEAGLAYVGESQVAEMVTENLPRVAAEALCKLTRDFRVRSQYSDFITNRAFRRSVLCRSGRMINRQLESSRLEAGYFSALFPSEQPGLRVSAGAECVVVSVNGRHLTTDHPVLKSLLVVLENAKPCAMSFPEICNRVEQQLSEESIVPPPRGTTMKLIADNLLDMVLRGDVEHRYIADRYVGEVSAQPRISKLGRLQAQEGMPITTPRHEVLQVDSITRYLLTLLDGSRDLQQLAQQLQVGYQQKQFLVPKLSNSTEILDPIAATTQILSKLCAAGVLVG